MSLISNWVAFAIQKKIYFSNKHSPLSFLVLPVVSPFLNTLLLFFNSLGSLLPFFEHTSIVPSPFFFISRVAFGIKKKNILFSHTFSCLPFFLTHFQLSPKHSPFFFILQFAFAFKKTFSSFSLSIVSPFLVHSFPSPFTVISLFSNTFSCPPHSLFF